MNERMLTVDHREDVREKVEVGAWIPMAQPLDEYLRDGAVPVTRKARPASSGPRQTTHRILSDSEPLLRRRPTARPTRPGRRRVRSRVRAARRSSAPTRGDPDAGDPEPSPRATRAGVAR